MDFVTDPEGNRVSVGCRVKFTRRGAKGYVRGEVVSIREDGAVLGVRCERTGGLYYARTNEAEVTKQATGLKAARILGQKLRAHEVSEAAHRRFRNRGGI